MGNGISKLALLPDKKKQQDTDPADVQIDRLKQDAFISLHEDCISPHFGKSGVAFYAPLDGDCVDRDKRPHGFEYKEKTFVDSLKSKEREIMAGRIVEQTLQEKVRKARMTEEKRMLVLRRRERKEEELRNRYEGKIKKIEERKQEVQNRLRPQNSNVRPLHFSKTITTP